MGNATKRSPGSELDLFNPGLAGGVDNPNQPGYTNIQIYIMVESDIRVDFQSRVALHEQIAQSLRERLAQGELPQGMRLPAVRRMAEALQVHFNTVAHAYRQLEQEGLLSTRPGRGTFVWRTKQLQAEKEQPGLEALTIEYVRSCRERGYSEMDILRELRKQMLPFPGPDSRSEPG